MADGDAASSRKTSLAQLDDLLLRWPLLPHAVAAATRRLLAPRRAPGAPAAAQLAAATDLLHHCTPAHAPGGSFQAYAADRVRTDDGHPFLVRAAHAGAQGVPPPFLKRMAVDLQLLRSVARQVDAVLAGLGVAAGTPSYAATGSDRACRRLDGRQTHRGTEAPWATARAAGVLRRAFEQEADDQRLAACFGDFVHRFGLGVDQGRAAYRLSESAAGDPALEPIAAFAAFDLGWLRGIDDAIDVLDHNTRALLDGGGAHNALIWGPRGCGKSSLVRGLITRYWEQGLRGVEVASCTRAGLRRLFDHVRHRRECFVAVLDNLSLRPDDPSARALSTVLDGSLEAPPDNLVFYATSNFKDLIDRAGARPQGPPPLQTDDAPPERRSTAVASPSPVSYDPQGFQRLDERRAVDDRFPLKVFVDLPTKSQYESLVLDYARRAGLQEEEQTLLAEFRVWCLRNQHDLIGGRTARDFVGTRRPQPAWT